MDQTACKPGFVHRALAGHRMGNHSSATLLAKRLTRHTRGAGQRQPIYAPYLVLLRAGFTMRALLPAPR